MAKVKERDYQAESDAYTLMEAERIKSNKTRFNKAKKAASDLAKLKSEEAKSAKKVAGRTKK